MIKLTSTENILMSFCKGVLKFPGINSQNDQAIRELYKYIYGTDDSTTVTAYAYATLANALHRILLKTQQGHYTLSHVIFNELRDEYSYHQLLCNQGFYHAVYKALEDKVAALKTFDTKDSIRLIDYNPVRELPQQKAV